jgi:hypothetical protein
VSQFEDDTSTRFASSGFVERGKNYAGANQTKHAKDN